MKIYYSSLLVLLSSQSAFARDRVEFGVVRDLHRSKDHSFSHSVIAKSVKTSKVEKGKTSKTLSPIPIDATTDDMISTDDVPGSAFSYEANSLSYKAKSQKVMASGKTGKEAKSASSEDNTPDGEASAKADKITAKVVRAMPITMSGSTEAAATDINAAENSVVGENAAGGAGAFFAVLAVGAVGAMIAWAN